MADAPSTIPHAFHGSIYTADGLAAPEGSIVIASVHGKTAGSITVTPSGRYGTQYAGGEKLIVWDPSLHPGDPIIFYIDGVPAAESTLFESGGVSNLTLTATEELPDERPVRSAAMPVTSVAGKPVEIDVDGASVQLTTTENYIGETMVFTFFSAPSKGQGIPGGLRSLGRFAHITSTIPNDTIEKAIVRFSYSADDLQGTAENSIRVFLWNGNSWRQLQGGVDMNTKQAWGETDSFSSFALFGTPVQTGRGGGARVRPDVTVTPTPTTILDPPVTEEEIPPIIDDADVDPIIPSTEEEKTPSPDIEAEQVKPDSEVPEGPAIVAVIIGAGIVIIAAIAFILYRQR